MSKKLKITQIKSRIGAQRKHKNTLDALGLRKNYNTVYRNDNQAVRGMLRKVSHLVSWEEVDDKDIPSREGSSTGVTVISGSGEKKSANENEKGSD
jgi:large subunit ribosomal protein L30